MKMRATKGINVDKKVILLWYRCSLTITQTKTISKVV